jgi:hypothetical protein
MGYSTLITHSESPLPLVLFSRIVLGLCVAPVFSFIGQLMTRWATLGEQLFFMLTCFLALQVHIHPYFHLLYKTFFISLAPLSAGFSQPLFCDWIITAESKFSAFTAVFDSITIFLKLIYISAELCICPSLASLLPGSAAKAPAGQWRRIELHCQGKTAGTAKLELGINI